MSPDKEDLTQLLRQSRAGDQNAVDQVVPLFSGNCDVWRAAFCATRRPASRSSLRPWFTKPIFDSSARDYIQAFSKILREMAVTSLRGLKRTDSASSQFRN